MTKPSAALSTAALASILTLAALPACTDAERARFESAEGRRKQAAADTAIRERAGEHWDAVRWKDWSTASSYLEEAQDQLRFVRLRAAEPPGVTLDEIDIQYVFVDPKAFDTAEVRVTWRQTSTTDPVVRPGQVTHRWYRKDGLWWLSPDSVLPPS